MNATAVLKALNGVDDKHITSYMPFQSASKADNKPNHSVKQIWKWVSIAACIALVVCAIPIAVHYFEPHNAPDPHWHETHVQLTDQNEAIATFGDDLLLDRIIVPGVSDSLYQEYILEHSGEDPTDRSTWDFLSCWLRYGAEHHYDAVDAELYISIYFSDAEAQTVYSDFLKHRNNETEYGTVEINGLTVEYFTKQETDSSFTEARFSHNGFDYYVSGDNYELVMKTLHQMLD